MVIRNISRRTLLKESIGLAVASAASMPLFGFGGSQDKKVFAYVGTYSGPGASGTGGAPLPGSTCVGTSTAFTGGA